MTVKRKLNRSGKANKLCFYNVSAFKTFCDYPTYQLTDYSKKKN